MTRTVARDERAIETATVTVIENGNEAAMEVAMSMTVMAGAAGGTEAETTTTEGMTATTVVGVVGTIATT